MLLYGVFSIPTESVAEFFPTLQEAEAMIAEVAAGEPETARTLRVEAVEFDLAVN